MRSNSSVDTNRRRWAANRLFTRASIASWNASWRSLGVSLHRRAAPNERSIETMRALTTPGGPTVLEKAAEAFVLMRLSVESRGPAAKTSFHAGNNEVE
jgi:hypothetical protein